MDMLILLAWALPATIGLTLTFREHYLLEQSVFNWRLLAGFAVCLLWPLTLPVLFIASRMQKRRARRKR